MDGTTVTVAGRVRGKVVAGNVRATLGIPYAAPPFGAGRFRGPRPAEAWEGVRDCTRFGPVAPQSAELPGAPGWSPGPGRRSRRRLRRRAGEDLGRPPGQDRREQ